MKLVFLGTPAFAVPALEAIVGAGHLVVAVLTQPDRPSGRGQALAPPPVKRIAAGLGLPVHQPERIRHPGVVGLLASLGPDAMVVVGYGQLIPQTIIDIAPHGILNVHASLLPNYRGAAPIQWALAHGETRTGVTIMRIDAGLDTGDILLTAETTISPEENAVELSGRLARMGASLLVETLRGLEKGTLVPVRQDHAQATSAPILKKEDGLVDWTRRALDIHNRVRGFLPWPGAHTRFRGQAFQVWRSRPAAEMLAAAPGSLYPLKRRLLVACGQRTALELLEVQLEGRKRVTAEAFLNGHRVTDNEVLGD